MRLWPASLYGRLVLILIVGMLAAQALTSTIWYDVRHAQVLEIPTRLLAGRLADLLRLERQQPGSAESLLRQLESPDFRLLAPEQAPPAMSRSDALKREERLLRRVITERNEAPVRLRLLRVEVIDNHDHAASLPVLFGSEPARGRFLVALTFPDGQERLIEATERQGWTSNSPLDLLLDYLLRIYLLRIAIVVLLALLAVRLALRPLQQMAAAAEALGENIHRAPLPLDGPLELRQAAQAFNAMQRRLIAGLAERTRFLAAVSHDLRTPITRLRLRTELLPDEPLRERFRDDLQHMQQMVEASLEYLSRGELDEVRERVEINALVDSLCEDQQALGAEIRISGRAQPLLAHPGGLRRCLQNLLDNAVRHAGGLIEVNLQDSPAQLCIEIADRGPGIAPERLQRVLEPLYLADGARSERNGGYGLGLGIAQHIAVAHGGSLTLQPRDGGGLLARLTLPRTQ